MRWHVRHYAEALQELRLARIEYNKKIYKVFRGLTKSNGFDISHPERLTRRKREQIKHLCVILALLRARDVVVISTRNKKRRRNAEIQSGIKSKYLAHVYIVVVPGLRTRVMWREDQPVIDYPNQGIRSRIYPFSRHAMLRDMREAIAGGDDAGDGLYNYFHNFGRRLDDLRIPKGKERYFRLRGIYGDFEFGSAYPAYPDAVELMDEQLLAVTERYGINGSAFPIGVIMWDVKWAGDIPETYRKRHEGRRRGKGKNKQFGKRVR